VPNWRREFKVIEALPKLVQLQKLGYFHSQLQWGKTYGSPRLSNPDKKWIGEVNLEIIVAINDAERSVSWRQSKNQLSGTIEVSHRYRRVLQTEKRQPNHTVQNFISPYAIGFDYTFV